MLEMQDGATALCVAADEGALPAVQYQIALGSNVNDANKVIGLLQLFIREWACTYALSPGMFIKGLHLIS